MPNGIQTLDSFFQKNIKNLRVVVPTLENSNERQKHIMKSLSGIQIHLALITLLKRTEVDDNCIYVVVLSVLLTSGRTFVVFRKRTRTSQLQT